MDPKDSRKPPLPEQMKSQGAAPQTTEEPSTKTVCVVSRAAFGHHLRGHHLPRNKPVLINVPVADIDADSRQPTHESWLGQQIATHPGLLEFIDEEDVRASGGKHPQTGAEIKPADRAKKIETVKVCAFSTHPRGHYRERMYWASNGQAPLVYEMPRSALRRLENDKHLVMLSPSKPDATGKRTDQVPPGAISGAKYFQELAEQQERDRADNEVYERVRQRKVEDDRRRAQVTRANAT